MNQQIIKLLTFGDELTKGCEKINIHPVVYGSLAYLFYTQNHDAHINDIDLLISKENFQKIISLIQSKPNLRYEETTYNSIKVFKDDIKISFDSNEDYLKNIDFKTQEVKIGDYPFLIVDKETLQEVYKRGAETIPFKKDAYTLKLQKLQSS